MSARVLRKLREDREAALAAAAEDDGSDSEEEIATPLGGKAKSAFAMMNDSSSEDSEEDSEEASEEEEGKEVENWKTEEKNENEGGKSEENLDSLIEEFKEQDVQKQSAKSNDDVDVDAYTNLTPILLQGIDQRELDVDFVMRTSLVSAEPLETTTNNSSRVKRRNRHTFLFGNPRDLNVNVKPPHLVGGGIGMSNYDRDTDSSRDIPWPYVGSEFSTSQPESEAWQDRKRWYTFVNSDSYDKDCLDFKRIQKMGDMNALVMFVAHHPFVTEALVTLGLMLYQVNQAQEGLTLLRRALWVYESATLAGFTARIFEDQCLMDYKQKENQSYFTALFQLARVNQMAGLYRASFATARYLLSLDPLRDPMGISLALDFYALSSNADQWLVDLYESKNLKVYYRDAARKIEYHCDLKDLPNWSYSYALAMFRLNDSRPCVKANHALKTAINEFPLIVDLLLSENGIDVTSQSCRMDWQAVIDYTGTRANAIHGSEAMNSMEPVVRMATERAHDLIIRVFAKLNHKLWASDQAMLWLHSSLEELKKSEVCAKDVLPLSPALMRYSRIYPGEYEMKFQLLPAEANPLDMGLVQHAFIIDPNRRRFLRNQRAQRGDEDDNLFPFGQGNAVRPTLLGPPRNVVDLDWPILEIFWRSLMPWNRIDQIPRPRRLDEF